MLRTVRAVIVDSQCDPVILITKVDYAPLTRDSYCARLSTGELIEHKELDKLLMALARRAKKGELL